MKTWTAKPLEVERKWWLVDADGQTLGRMATEIANLLRGKNKPQFTPHVDTGDFVVVINAEKVKMSGNKMTEKTYFTHSLHFGSLKRFTANKLQEQKPEKLVTLAVKGMLPENKLSFKLMTKLKVYKGSAHPHAAQKLETLSLKTVGKSAAKTNKMTKKTKGQ